MKNSKLSSTITKKIVPALLVLLTTASLSNTSLNLHSAHASHYHSRYSRKISYRRAQEANNVLQQLIANSNNKQYETHHFKRTIRRNHHKVRVQTKATVPTRQANYQKRLGYRTIRRIRHQAMRHHYSRRYNWYADGLSTFQQQCRAKVVYMESHGYWNISNYNGTCLGRFQLSRAYLMHHGHLDMSPKYQVHVADSYVKARYGNWYNALQFHYIHGWY